MTEQALSELLADVKPSSVRQAVIRQLRPDSVFAYTTIEGVECPCEYRKEMVQAAVVPEHGARFAFATYAIDSFVISRVTPARYEFGTQDQSPELCKNLEELLDKVPPLHVYKGILSEDPVTRQHDSVYVDLVLVPDHYTRKVFSRSHVEAAGATEPGTQLEYRGYRIGSYVITHFRKTGEPEDEGWVEFSAEAMEMFTGNEWKEQLQ